MTQISKDVPTVDLVKAMFSQPFGSDNKWAYRHGAYKEIRKHQRRGTEFTIKWSDDIWTLLILGDEDWYVVPTKAVIQ